MNHQSKSAVLFSMLHLIVQLLAGLPWNDVNILIVTDVHSWIAGHVHPDHQPALDATYGDVLSLYTHLSSAATKGGRDLFFVQNGDLNDGTGFSRVPPAELVPLLQRLPFDALTTGNHELYKNEEIEYLAKAGGFVESWGGRFLTSNVLNATTRQPIGARSRLLVGKNSGVRVLAFGFLYNMPDHDDGVAVTEVADTVKEAWFVEALNATKYDALLFLAHMDFADPLVDVLHGAVRAVVGRSVPIQFVTGHSHIRAYRDLDDRAASFEAGRYLDTIGFASFGLDAARAAGEKLDETRAAGEQNNAYAYASSSFAHVDIEANVAAMAAAAGLADAAALPTPSGVALATEIARVGAALGLDARLGCSPKEWHSYASLSAADSLWALYLYHVMVEQALGSNASLIVVQSTGSLRYNLYEGEVTLNDVETMAPFADRFWRVTACIEGDELAAVLHALGASDEGALDGSLPRDRGPRDRGPRDWRAAVAAGSLPQYAVTSAAVPGQLYDLWTLDFDLSHVVDVFEAQTGRIATPELVLVGQNTTSVWASWIEKNWHCALTPVRGVGMRKRSLSISSVR